MLYVVLGIMMVILDQISKYVVVNTIKKVSTVPIIKGVFHLTYCENKGAAFSVFSSNTLMLTAITIVFISAVGYFLYKTIKKDSSIYAKIALLMVFSGAVGNLIDRIRLGYVVDFFDFRLINFAIFNVADIFITLGGILFCIMIFVSDDDIL